LKVVINAVDKHEEEIIEAIKEGKIKFIEGEECENIIIKEKKEKDTKKKTRTREKEKKINYNIDYQTCINYKNKKDCEVCEKNVVHAEMKIIRDILEKKGLSSTASSSSMELNEELEKKMSLGD